MLFPYIGTSRCCCWQDFCSCKMNESIPTAVLSTCSHQAVTYLLVQILTVILNFVAFIVLSQIKGYKGNTNHFVVRILVLSDAVGAVTTATPISMSCLGYTLHNSNVCQAFGFLSNVILLWTVLIVLLMCILRYLAVVRPLFYRTYVTFTAVKWLLVGLLIWSSAHIVLPLFGVGRFKYFPIGQYCSFEIPPERKRDFALVHLIVWEGWLFIVILIYLTVSMVRELSVKRKHASRLSFQQRRGIHANRIRQRGYTRMTVVIVTIFLVCYIPFLVSECYLLTGNSHEDSSPVRFMRIDRMVSGSSPPSSQLSFSPGVFKVRPAGKMCPLVKFNPAGSLCHRVYN